GVRPIGILPVQNAHSAYHVAALNNLYARAPKHSQIKAV
ncbi:MAG: hypothetical protein RLZZ32_1557, partial [Cyanobacteriota bacterium]